MRATVGRVTHGYRQTMESGVTVEIPTGTPHVITDDLPEGEVRFNGRALFVGATTANVEHAKVQAVRE